jgi:hypothetical protein
MDEPISCPPCGAPARITERFRLGSTAGPVSTSRPAASTTTGSPRSPRWWMGPRWPCLPRSRHRFLPDRANEWAKRIRA